MKIPAAKAVVDQEWEKLEKIPASDLTTVINESEVIDETWTKGIKVHFASPMDICHLKNAELGTKHQKCKGRVVLRGDTVKDDSGCHAVFTEQRSSASQMTAATVMDIISRLPGCAGQAADAVSASTQVKMEDGQKWLKIPKSECPDIWIRSPRHKWPKSWSSMEDPVVLLELNLYGHPLAGLLWERQFEKIQLKHVWEKITNWECLFVHREKGLFLSVYVDDITLAGKKQNIDPMWNVLNKEVDLGEPTSFFDHENLGCTQRQCERRKDIVDNYRTMFKSRISAGATENYHARKIWVSLRGPTIWKDMPRNVWNGSVSWQTGRLNNCAKYLLHASMTITSKKKNWNPWEKCQKYALKLFWNAKLGTYWTTRYSKVSEQTCTMDHKMDQSLWQRITSFDLFHS